MKKWLECAATSIAVATVMVMPLRASAAPPPSVINANDGIFQAFATHPVVAIAEWHGLAQELDYYNILIRDPRFAQDVGNIVLETGDATHQSIVDRYVNGEAVPYTELRKVWADTAGWFPSVVYTGSQNVYAAIRSINMSLPPDKRIKVWLGDPPIDWSNVKTKADWQPVEDQRDTYPAHLIEREILEKNKKTLVIYGADHVGLYPGVDNIRAELDKTHPGALFLVSPYVGYAQKDCAVRFEKHIKGWAVPSLIEPIQGTSLEKDIYRPGCAPFLRPDGLAEALYEIASRNNLGATSDALLYLGPRNQQVTGPVNPDVYLDLDYRAELARRYLIRTGQPFADAKPENYHAVAKPFWQN